MGVYFMLVFIFVLIIPDIYKIADSLATELKLNTAGALIISWYLTIRLLAKKIFSKISNFAYKFDFLWTISKICRKYLISDRRRTLAERVFIFGSF